MVCVYMVCVCVHVCVHGVHVCVHGVCVHVCMCMCVHVCVSFISSIPLPTLITEVVGAVISVLIIWLLTGVLVYEAILRIINQNYEINADVMLITAAGGVFVNVL